MIFPRLTSRGPIEGALFWLDRICTRRFPRLTSRGPIEGAPASHTVSTVAFDFRGSRAAAPLKGILREQPDVAAADFRGSRAAAPLKVFMRSDPPFDENISAAHEPRPH